MKPVVLPSISSEGWAGMEQHSRWCELSESRFQSNDEITASTLQLRANIFDGMRPENDSFRPIDDVVIEARRSELLVGMLGMRGIKAIRELLLRPWWHRLWVRQELLLAQHLLLICGADLIPGVDILRGLTYGGAKGVVLHIAKFHAATPLEQSQVARLAVFICNLDWQMQHREQFSRERLLDLVEVHHTAACELGHDKIFGLLGIATDDMVQLNAPDYSLSVEEVYERLARTSIETSQSLEILYMRNVSDTSSWIPDWGRRTFRSRIVRKPVVKPQAPFYYTSLDHTPRCGFPPTLSGTRPRVLEVSGFELDVVDQRECRLPWDVDDAPIAAYIEQRKRLSSTAAWLSEEDFWLLLTLDRDSIERLTPDKRSDFLSTAQTWAQSGNQTDWPSENFKKLVGNCDGMWLFTTKRNRFAGVIDSSVNTLPGYLVCILFGSQVPFILRPQGEHYKRIGCCYVRGIMDGEAFSMDIGAESNHRIFSII